MAENFVSSSFDGASDAKESARARVGDAPGEDAGGERRAGRQRGGASADANPGRGYDGDSLDHLVDVRG